VLIGDLALASTRKFRNIARHKHVPVVVDDLASVDPCVVRGIEVRAPRTAEVEPPRCGGVS
jgi:pyridoxamine 5'-phosphate oxidase family protein